MSAIRSLLTGIVDYAGVFPPASLDMGSAVGGYASYRASPDAWMLGRFVLPVASLDEFARARVRGHGSDEWLLSAVVGADIEADLRRARDFNRALRGRARIDTLEVKVASPEEIRHVASAAGSDFVVFVEIPWNVDPAPLVIAAKNAHVDAKIRTGGVIADAIPTAESIVRFMRACLDQGVPFKATAGLHHPLRAEYPLTYASDAPRGVMFGYLNVFAAAALMANGLSDSDAARLLEERDAAAFDVTSDALSWQGHRLTADQARQAREHVAVSFGSCSFREPVDELRALAMTPLVTMLDETHDPSRLSWVESANDPATDFPIQNLAFCVYSRGGDRDVARVGVAIGDQIVDVVGCNDAGLIGTEALAAVAACNQPRLNDLMRLGRGAARSIRHVLSRLLRAGSEAESARARILVPMSECELQVPADVGDYTDFYASIHHATNVGSMFRPDNPLLPNYKWIPIGYHGRASSIIASGTDVRRPWGQTRDAADGPPTFGPTRRLDYELEVGAFIGRGNDLGSSISIDEAEEHVFGLCLVNDWSARDVQAWEYQPLGPFLAKSFATTVSPWVVTLDALEPYRVPALVRSPGDPATLPYLSSEQSAARGGIDITLEVSLSTAQMRAAHIPPERISQSSFATLYWTLSQFVTHHTSNGCNLRPGDLLASGTVSGETKESRGCLLERTWRGTEPLQLPTGETRAFLQDGDEVTLRGFSQRDGYRRIGFGECRGRIVPARTLEAQRVEVAG